MQIRTSINVSAAAPGLVTGTRLLLTGEIKRRPPGRFNPNPSQYFLADSIQVTDLEALPPAAGDLSPPPPVPTTDSPPPTPPADSGTPPALQPAGSNNLQPPPLISHPPPPPGDALQAPSPTGDHCSNRQGIGMKSAGCLVAEVRACT